MYPIQIFWNTLEAENGQIPPMQTGSKMYRHGRFVLFEHQEFDRRDSVTYYYSAKFYVELYEKALKNLKQKGKAKMIGMGYSLALEKKNQRLVEVTFQGIPEPKRDPNAELVTARLTSCHKLEDLLLRE